MKTRICVPVSERTPELALESAGRAIDKGADLLEIRIDTLREPDPDSVKELIDDIGFPVIATCRPPSEGGHYRGGEDERMVLLEAAAEAADYVDVELRTDQEHIMRVTGKAKRSIISYHNFSETPSLEALLRIVRMEKELGDMAKVAVMPENMADTLVVLQLLAVEDETIAISMGEMGSYTRAVCALFGSPITFASLDASTAPGQMDLERTRTLIENLILEDD